MLIECNECGHPMVIDSDDFSDVCCVECFASDFSIIPMNYKEEK